MFSIISSARKLTSLEEADSSSFSLFSCEHTLVIVVIKTTHSVCKKYFFGDLTVELLAILPHLYFLSALDSTNHMSVFVDM